MARTFYDDELRPWAMKLTWDKADEIFERCERPDSTPENRKTFDLFNMTDKDQIDAFIVSNPQTGRFNRHNAQFLVNILYVLCEEQCQEREMSDVDFGEMMATGVFSKAMEAFMDELANFIQDPERKKMFQNLLFLAGGNQAAVLSEANQILTEKRIALAAQTTQIIGDKMMKAWKPVEDALTKVAEDGGTINSSKSAGLSGLSPAVN